MKSKIILWIVMILGAILMLLTIIYFGFFKQAIYDSDFYSIGSDSITLNAKTAGDHINLWQADLTDNRIQRYDIIWTNQGKVLSKDCPISMYVTNPSDDPRACGNRQENTIGQATISDGILSCKLLTLSCGHYKDTYNSPRIKWVFITPQPKIFYRFLNNQCSQISILEFEKTTGDYYTLAECQSNIISLNEPIPPNPSGWERFKNYILDLIKKFLSIFKTQTISGQVLIAPGSTQTYNIDLTAPSPDVDYSDGYYEVQYANWILSDEDGNMIEEGTWEKINGIYKKSITITVPDVQDKNFIIASIITQINGTYNYNTGQWAWTEEVPIMQEGIDIKTKYSISPPVDPTPSGWSKFWTAIKDFFCRYLPFLCS